MYFMIYASFAYIYIRNLITIFYIRKMCIKQLNFANLETHHQNTATLRNVNIGLTGTAGDASEPHAQTGAGGGLADCAL